MKKINRRSFLAAAGLTAAALALTACGGSASSTASSTASSAAVSTSAAAELTTVEAGKLTMATNATFPPYEMTTDSGEIRASMWTPPRQSLRSWAWSCRSMIWTSTQHC